MTKDKTGQGCNDCHSCGWMGTGSYPDGRRYYKCEFYGTFLLGKTESRCERKMTPMEVQRFKNQETEKKTWKKRK